MAFTVHVPASPFEDMTTRRDVKIASIRCRHLVSEAGFTLAETLTAVTVLTVALVALLFATGFGVTGLDSARRSTTALFLAERRLEEVKAWAMSDAAARGWANVTAANFPAEGYATITGYGDYRRTVTITDNPGGVANTKQIEVFVFYRPVSTSGVGGETSVSVSTLLVLK
jgi:Tfp pilus assembly protein PilV